MRRWGALIGSCLCGVAMACPPPWPQRPWSEVQSIVEARPALDLSGYASHEFEYVFSLDGRFARILRNDPDGRRHATFGRYRRAGAWIETRIDGGAIDPATLPPQERHTLERWIAQSSVDATEAGAGVETPTSSGPQDDLELDDARWYDPRRLRLLRLPYLGGEVLIHHGDLAESANAWRGVGAFVVTAGAWRLPVPFDGDAPLEVAFDPAQSRGLPHELLQMLPAGAIEARVAAVLESPAALDWSHGSATLHLRLDRGASGGLYEGMALRGVPPDDDLQGLVVAVRHDQALLRMDVERFSPWDAVSLPTPGLRLVSRSDAPKERLVARPVLRPRVLARAALPAEDDESLDWVDLELAEAQGLEPGDVLHGEGASLVGEGRVLWTAAGRAGVRWRVMPFALGDATRLPAPGDMLVRTL